MQVTWEIFKTIATERNLSVQWIDLGDSYELKLIDGMFILDCNIPRSDVARTTDFETNYKPTGNRQIQPLDSDGQPILSVKRIRPLYSFHDLKRPSNGTRAMNVNGTVGAPIHFEFKPQGTDIWEVENLRVGMDDVGLTDMGLFAGIAALTNGIEISVKAGPNTMIIGVVKDNIDFVLMFPGQAVGQSGVLDTSDGLVGIWSLKDPIELRAANNDYIRMSVRDDLRGINILRAMVSARKVL